MSSGEPNISFAVFPFDAQGRLGTLDQPRPEEWMGKVGFGLG